MLSSFILAQIHFKPPKHQHMHCCHINLLTFHIKIPQNTYHLASYIVVMGSLILALIKSFNPPIPKTWVSANLLYSHIKAPDNAHHNASQIVAMCSLTLASLKSTTFNLPNPKKHKLLPHECSQILSITPIKAHTTPTTNPLKLLPYAL